MKTIGSNWSRTENDCLPGGSQEERNIKSHTERFSRFEIRVASLSGMYEMAKPQSLS